MDLLFYWKPSRYRSDARMGPPTFSLRQQSAKMHEISAGESVWAFTRNRAGRYVLACELIVEHFDREDEDFAVYGDDKRSRYFDIDVGNDVEPTIRSLGLTTRASLLGQSFQGPHGVQHLGPDAAGRLRQFAATQKLDTPQAVGENVDSLRLGTTLTNDQLMEQFDVGLMGGMRRSVDRGHLVVVSDHTTSLYVDRWEERILHYTGMGKRGPQSLTSQNRTLAESPTSGVHVYLFEVFEPGRYIFHGRVELAGAHYQEQQADDDGRVRTVWMFPLRLLDDTYELPLPSEQSIRRIQARIQRSLSKLSLAKLKKRAQASPRMPGRMPVRATQYVRNEAVAAYVKKAANGQCDLCSRPAPFVGKHKEPYLECHHVKHLSDQGSDTIDNAVALCPNCHRMMHVLNQARQRKRLHQRIVERDAS